MAGKTQARGYQGKIRVLFEKEYRTLPADPAAILLPVITASLDGGRALNAKSTLRGKRSPGKPDVGNMSGGGDMQNPANIHAMGVLLKMLCGAPVTTAEAPNLTLSGSAVDEGAGYVKLNCAGHGLRNFTQVTISGTTNYDGIHLVQPKSGVDDIVIESVYAAEDFDGTEPVRRGACRNLDATPAVDKTGGKVGIPCAGHGYVRGETITLAGTTNYNGDHVVLVSGRDEIVIESAYTAEVFAGTEGVSPKLFKHVFKLLDDQPSFELEEEIPLTAATHNDPFWLSEGCKVSSFSCSSSGDGQLSFSVGVVSGNVRKLPQTVAKSTTDFADHDFKNFDGDLVLGGEQQASVTSASVQVSTNLDSSIGYVKGSKGTLMSLPEGEPSVSGALTAHYTDTELSEKAMDGVVLDYSLGFVAAANQLTLNFPESLIEPKGVKPKLSGPQGIVIECNVQAFEDSNEHGTCFYAELINGIATY